MSGYSEKIVISSSKTTNMDKTAMIPSSSNTTTTTRVMEKQPQDQQPLKCPRCDSLNTKFCYYNNYSLTQPRHFCKACKRYWTRGGTLRNVPVGGGYRKNKKIKKSSSGGSDAAAPPQLSSISTTHLSHQIDNMGTNHVNPMFYGLSGNSYTDFPFSRFSSRTGYPETLPASCTTGYEEYGGTGFNHNMQYQDLISSSNSILSNLSLLGPSSSSPGYSTTASLLGLQQPKQVMGKETRSTSNFQALIPFQGLQMGRNGGDVSMGVDEMKIERKATKMEWSLPCLNQTQLLGSSDPSLNWNSTSGGAWTDLSNYGSSVTPLI